MASFYDKDHNAVSGLYGEANFSSSLFIPIREEEFEWVSILTKYSGTGSKINHHANDLLFWFVFWLPSITFWGVKVNQPLTENRQSLINDDVIN